MRSAYALSLLGWCILCPGCALVEDSSRNLCVALSTPIETQRENARNRKWAEEAWQHVCLTPGRWPRSVDYARGFKDGYMEYLFRGGDGEPPLVAPLRYRHMRYQTPDGYRAIEDWFAGYRHGAALARDTGARNWITGPSGLHGEPSEATAPSPIPAARIEESAEIVLAAQAQANPEEPIEPAPLASEPVQRDPLAEPETGVQPLQRDPLPEPETNIQPVEALRAKITNILAPPPEAEPRNETPAAPEPATIKILKVHEAAPALLESTRARITGIRAVGATEAPVRARITTITVAPPKD